MKIEELRKLVKESIMEFTAPQPAQPKREKEVEVAPAKEKEAKPLRRGLPTPEKAPEPTPKGQKKEATATEMSVANKIADKFNKQK
jgi:hypothetical protein